MLGSLGGATRIAALSVVLLVVGPGAWFFTDHLEQDNDFCNACHLSEDAPLHIQIRDEFDGRPPQNLAALHASEGAGAHRPRRSDPGEFRCIDCHAGVGLIGRARVKALAAKDAFFWAIRRYEEPSGMQSPLWDRDCRQCHASFARKAVEEWQDPAFHDLALHNVELGVDCVECHLTHRADVDPDAYFLKPDHVRARCAQCHPEFEEGT